MNTIFDLIQSLNLGSFAGLFKDIAPFQNLMEPSQFAGALMLVGMGALLCLLLFKLLVMLLKVGLFVGAMYALVLLATSGFPASTKAASTNQQNVQNTSAQIHNPAITGPSINGPSINGTLPTQAPIIPQAVSADILSAATSLYDSLVEKYYTVEDLSVDALDEALKNISSSNFQSQKKNKKSEYTF